MRSRPELTVLLDPGNPFPGEELLVEARFVSTSDTPLDRVLFELAGVETIRVPQGKSEIVRRHDHVRLRAEIPGKPLTPGTHTYRARFSLPPRLPAPYSGRYASVAYALEVRADIPWWPDRVGKYEIPIRPLPVEAKTSPSVFVTDLGGVRTGVLYAELSLGSTAFEPGGEIAGTVALHNAGSARGTSVALVASERISSDAGFFEGGSIREIREAQRWSLVLADDPPAEGVGLPFRLAIPGDVIPGYAGAISALEWAVEITTRSLFSRNTVLRVPIQIVPGASRARRPTPVAIPAVGRERHAQILARVGRGLGLQLDPESVELRGERGAVGVRIAAETRPDGALATVAHLVWPPLGMRFSVAPRTWTDLLSTHAVASGVAAFDRRYQARGRFAEQVRALLDAELCALLLGFDEATITDEGATLLAARALVEEGPLADFAGRAARVTGALDAAFARVPLPPALAGGADAWRALAERLGGRFEPGRGAIHEGTLGLERVQIVTEWDDDGELQATIVRVALDPRVDPETISPAARALAESLAESAGGRVTIEADAVTLSIARAIVDPGAIEPALDGLARLAHAVRHRVGASPFRS
jgi:hypothetical protein